MTAKLMKCNIKHEYSAVKKVSKYRKIEEDKREAKEREKIAFKLEWTVTTYQNQLLL